MIFIISVFGQIIIVQHGGAAFQTVPLKKEMWYLSVIIGVISIPIGAIIRFIPDDVIHL
jgi:Ca2+-transporting ATPase